MKKIMAMFLCAILTLAVAVPALAGYGNTEFTYTFTDDTTTVGLATAQKNDNQQYWFLTLKSVSSTSTTTGPSSTNIFGGRPKVGSTFGSSYYIWTGPVSSKQYRYTENLVTQHTTVTFRGKKDNTSSSSKNLKVVGVFCP